MLIAIKIGNSNLKIVVFEDFSKDCLQSLYDVSLKNINWTAIERALSQYKSADAVLCSVVPTLTVKFRELFEALFNKFFIVEHKLNTGMQIRVNNPDKFGADRLACSVAAYEKFKEDVAIIDAGTATTLTLVNKQAEILGGSIMPGIQMMLNCLHEKTAALPLVNINEDNKISPLGVDTLSAIRSGTVLGSVFALEGLLSEISKLISVNLHVLITGGYANLLSKYFRIAHHLEPYLVFEGMRLIYLKNIKT